jgi:protein SCO1
MPARRTDKRRRNARRTAIIVSSAAAALLLLTASYLCLLGGTMPASVPAIGGPFTLTEGNGQVITDRDLRGRYLLIYFGYTSCPDVCPTTLSAIADAIDILGSRAERLQPLFITVDPKHDTPAIVQAYVRSFGPHIIGLTGTPAEIRAVEQEYRISSVIQQSGSANGSYTIDHTAVLFLVAPDGRYLAPLAATESGAELAEKLARYMGDNLAHANAR